MAEMATYRGGDLATIKATSVALVRGVRVVRDSAGTVAVADNAVRGDYVTIQAIAADEFGAGMSCNDGVKVPALASEATAVGDAAYGTTSGKFSKTSANSTVMGRWTLAASGDGILGEVELLSVL